MSELVYKQIISDLKHKIFAGSYPDLRLPDERSLSESYKVSRSSVKRALNRMANDGMIFRKRGAGTFINPLYLKNESVFNYEESSNLGVTDNFKMNGKRPKTKVLTFEVIKPTAELRRDLFLLPDDFVYQIVRLRLFEKKPFMIETGFIPIKIVPELTRSIIKKSIFNYLQEVHHQAVTKSFLSVFAEPSTKKDQELLKLEPNEPTGVMEGIFFLDDGTPFEFSHMRFHYKYLKFNSFVSVN
ncbi:GntR family transcriptional regulator [Liquorilactobacillus satsumensis]|uniref:GntR family transcriptional regulator n=2 Tax=Liquorilactobacillus satsumensis TaxID=259059 RepID=A0A0R1UX50_9LACO|nr:GntR family transcriptional regulator [Liquorilactobacillus satsumensis]KRL97268.1 GntR family transcriptional regulator [Liquorilactobacillus satsumensis DSM 16230 = JCM 12392]MCC7666969.1 GntR family transcriptional regulator [Liquorilactobacillus satsumensis]MCP9312217.1 GntR family transcriptional regulator [Liquorilactobacillus satsumensis]MCP9328721.1 GntR family transcriptional regulator [Liquorilactobacillus satsumensis]MCP9357251.1 GntR family transcriptional regulator [Liquorilact